jgi:hypothetical protein
MESQTGAKPSGEIVNFDEQVGGLGRGCCKTGAEMWRCKI